ncbi:MAG: hypothetical protein KBA40_03360 [Candidatus Peribacteraceae bacterium]|nr:hypothetical protein [Candidatus Peribacteraceae bacterium]
MNSTSTDSPASERLQSVLPSQAHELLMVEKRERDRVEKEQESLRASETALEQEFATERAKEERGIAQEGMTMLQEFNQNDLTSLLKKESAETEQQAEFVKNGGLAGVNKAAKTLVDAAVSQELLSSL